MCRDPSNPNDAKARASSAIILAAGRGSRMGSLTGERPKCLTPLAGKSLLEWQLSALRRAGLTDITVIGGYRADSLAGDQYLLRCNPRWADTNMVTTLACAEELLMAEPCVVAYSDIVYRASHVRRLMEAPGELAITYDTAWEQLWALRFADPLDDAETFLQEDGVLRAIGGRPGALSEIQGQYMGLLRFTPAAWRDVRRVIDAVPAADRDRIDMTGLLRRLLDDGQSIRCVAVDGGWCEVDSESDLAAYERKLASNPAWLHDWRRD